MENILETSQGKWNWKGADKKEFLAELRRRKEDDKAGMQMAFEPILSQPDPKLTTPDKIDQAIYFLTNLVTETTETTVPKSESQLDPDPGLMMNANMPWLRHKLPTN
jgi:hypothetical protein